MSHVRRLAKESTTEELYNSLPHGGFSYCHPQRGRPNTCRLQTTADLTCQSLCMSGEPQLRMDCVVGSWVCSHVDRNSQTSKRYPGSVVELLVLRETDFKRTLHKCHHKDMEA
jgi:hypothetical protein